MVRLAGPLGVLLLVVNLALAALWWMLLHPGSSQPVGRAAAGSASSDPPLQVGPMLPPATPDCAPRPISSPINAPDGRPVAQLSRVPSTLSQSVAATFPPCAVPRRAPSVPQAPESERISFRILTVVRYEGSEGTVFVSTVRPSPAALSQGLDLGNPAGTLPDGCPAWSIGVTGECAQNHVRWLKDGLIITVASDMSVDRLKALAADVVLK